MPDAVGILLRRGAAAAQRFGPLAATRDIALAELDIPPEVLPHLTFSAVYDSAATRAALAGTGIEVPAFGDYAGVLVEYWREHLDPNRARRPRSGPPLQGRRVVITGASSGIGRETALKVARAGGVPLLVARRTEELEEVKAQVERDGGQAHVYSCDITDGESVDALVKSMLADHAGPDTCIDMLVNNAGLSIRRSVAHSFDRFHDYERTMAINYFGAVRLTLALLPHMMERRFGHVVDISSIGVGGVGAGFGVVGQRRVPQLVQRPPVILTRSGRRGLGWRARTARPLGGRRAGLVRWSGGRSFRARSARVTQRGRRPARRGPGRRRLRLRHRPRAERYRLRVLDPAAPGQCRQTQPRSSREEARDAVQNRTPIASWADQGCGHTSQRGPSSVGASSVLLSGATPPVVVVEIAPLLWVMRVRLGGPGPVAPDAGGTSGTTRSAVAGRIGDRPGRGPLPDRCRRSRGSPSRSTGLLAASKPHPQTRALRATRRGRRWARPRAAGWASR